MPELPEVEIHARNLRKWLVGKRLRGLKLLDEKLISDIVPPSLPVAEWDAAVAGRCVTGVRRLAKYLFIDLDGGLTLVAHLRMTGRFVYDAYAAGAMDRFTRMVLELEEGDRIRFEDRRKFGRAWLVPTERAGELPELMGLAPDALLEPTLPERLRELAGKTGRSIKDVLMDQRRIGGLGNICVIEILYRACIAPDRPARALSAEQVDRIARLIPEYLEWAIDVQSRRELIYLGEKGAVNVFTIYRREGAPCPQCGAAIVRTVQGGRGTYWCPGCQG